MFFGDVTDSAFAIKDNVSGVTLDWWNDLSHFPYLFTQLWLIEAGKSAEPAAGGGWIGKPFDVEINLNVLCINLFLCSPTASVAQKCSVFLTLGLCRRQFVDWFFYVFHARINCPQFDSTRLLLSWPSTFIFHTRMINFPYVCLLPSTRYRAPGAINYISMGHSRP